MSRKGVALSDNIIVSLFTMGCCKVLSSLNVWEFFFNHVTRLNSYHKALVPSRRVNYYKHVKFDLRDKYGFLCRTARIRCSGNSSQNAALKTSRNGYLDLRRTRKKDHSIGLQWIWPGFPIFYKTPPKVKVEECCQSHLDSALNGMICVRPIINESEWIWPGSYHANTAISPFLAAVAARHERFAGLRLLIILSKIQLVVYY